MLSGALLCLWAGLDFKTVSECCPGNLINFWEVLQSFHGERPEKLTDRLDRGQKHSFIKTAFGRPGSSVMRLNVHYSLKQLA